MSDPRAPGAWETELERAFAVLLGSRWTDAASTGYGVYYGAGYFDETLFPNTWITPESLTRSGPFRLYDVDDPAFARDPLSADAWPIDLAGSYFEFDFEALDEDNPWDDAFVAAVRAASVGDDADFAVVRGADLAPLLAEHGVDFTDESAARFNNTVGALLRGATDGTLLDAMKFATHTERGPDHLIPFTTEYDGAEMVESEWEEALAAIADPALRDHLRMICLDEDWARSYGSAYEGAKMPLAVWPLEQTGWPVIAGWLYGESQAGCVVLHERR